MSYVAVKGGQQPIEASLALLDYQKVENGAILELTAIKANLKLLIDQVMSEASLYAPDLAARAIRQGEGSVEEAVFLLRAYRSTLERFGYTEIIDTGEDMQVERRISAAFKNIPGGQILGASYDYSHRLIDFATEAEYLQKAAEMISERINSTLSAPLEAYPKVSTYLREQGIIQTLPVNDQEPEDMTKKILDFPTSRSERLQLLTRGMGQSLMAFAYSVIRGFGAIHPTVGELRGGIVPLYFEDYYLGSIEITETEMFIPVSVKQNGQEELEIEIGYGFVFGRNETKAISMGILDHSLEVGDGSHPTGDEEFVLYHIDAIEATGFLSHLKLPHYVTFQSKLDSIRKIGGNQHESV